MSADYLEKLTVQLTRTQSFYKSDELIENNRPALRQGWEWSHLPPKEGESP